MTRTPTGEVSISVSRPASGALLVAVNAGVGDRRCRLRGEQAQHLLVLGREPAPALLFAEEEVADVHAAVADRGPQQDFRRQQLGGDPERTEIAGEVVQSQRIGKVTQVFEEPPSVRPVGQPAVFVGRDPGDDEVLELAGLVDGEDPTAPGRGQRAGALDDLPQDGVEIEAAADAPNRCYQLREAVPRTLQSATLPRTPSDPYPGRHIGASLDPPSLPRQLSQNSNVVCSQKDTVVTPSPLRRPPPVLHYPRCAAKRPSSPRRSRCPAAGPRVRTSRFAWLMRSTMSTAAVACASSPSGLGAARRRCASAPPGCGRPASRRRSTPAARTHDGDPRTGGGPGKGFGLTGAHSAASAGTDFAGASTAGGIERLSDPRPPLDFASPHSSAITAARRSFPGRPRHPQSRVRSGSRHLRGVRTEPGSAHGLARDVADADRNQHEGVRVGDRGVRGGAGDPPSGDRGGRNVRGGGAGVFDPPVRRMDVPTDHAAGTLRAIRRHLSGEHAAATHRRHAHPRRLRRPRLGGFGS